MAYFHANSKSTSAKELQKKPGIIYNIEHKHGTKPCHRKKSEMAVLLTSLAKSMQGEHN